MKIKYLLGIILSFLFLNLAYSIELKTFKFTSPNKGYANSYTSSTCQPVAVIALDLGTCTNSITFTGPNIYFYFNPLDILNQYTITFDLQVGYYSNFNFTVNCGSSAYNLTATEYDCLEFFHKDIPEPETNWTITFPTSGYNIFKNVFKTNYLYDLGRVSCSVNCMSCGVEQKIYPSRTVDLVLSLQPLGNPCSAGNFTLMIYMNPSNPFNYYYNYTNQFFLNNFNMTLDSNFSYPNVGRPKSLPYLPNRPVWYLVKLSNVSPFYTPIITSYSDRIDEPFYPISGNISSSLMITAKIPDPYRRISFHFVGLTPYTSIFSSEVTSFYFDQYVPDTPVQFQPTVYSPNYLKNSLQFQRNEPRQSSTYIQWSQDSNIFSRFDYPFGYCQGGINNASHRSLHISGNYSLTIPSNIITYTTKITVPNDNFTSQPSTIRVNDVSFTPFGSYQYILRIDVSDTEYGIYKIQTANCVLLEKDLVSGNIYNGIFEKACPIQIPSTKEKLEHLFKVYSKSMTYVSFTTNFFVPFSDLFVPNMDYNFNIPLEDFTQVSLRLNVQNITDSEERNIFYFNITNPIKSYKPILEIFNSDFYGHKKQFVGQWNDKLGLYEIPFKVPMAYYGGIVPYRLITLPTPISNAEFFSLFGERSQLYLHSNNADMIGPIVEYIIFGNTEVFGKFNWRFAMSDEVNGFKDGYANITSSLDPHIQTRVNITRINGDMYYGEYQVNYTVTQDIDQNITISIWAIDNAGNEVTSYIDRNLPEYMNGVTPYLFADPFMKIYDTGYDDQLTGHYYAQGFPHDAQPPQLSYFTVNKNKIDVSVPNTLVFNFTLKDINTQYESNPIIYLQSIYDQTLQCQSVVLTKGPASNYSCELIVPYGFGASDVLLISIYGLRDSVGLLNGFTSDDLFNEGFTNTIIRTFDQSIPYLDRYEAISSNGGLLTVYGNQFGTAKSSIHLTINSRGQIIDIPNSDIVHLSNSILVFNAPSFESTLEYTLTMTRISKISNGLVIKAYFVPTSPTKTPTNTPTTKPCLNNCNQKGTCINSQCKCYPRWFGPDCSSELIPAPPPAIDPVRPGTNTTIVTPNQVTITSELSIASVREFNNVGEVVANYNLTNYKWSLLNNTKDSNTMIEYQYSTKINQTYLNVTIQWFAKDMSFVFAGDIYNVTANSVKYSVQLSKYNFQTQLNTLQVVLSATVTSKDASECSSKNYGVTGSDSTTKENEIRWMKLKVGYQSLYGRFIEKAVVDDDRVVSVSNVILDEKYQPSLTTTTTTQAFIGINLPHFDNNANIDPDFSNLIDPNPASNDPNSFCNRSKSKLNKYQIAGIAIGCSVAVIAAAGTFAYVKWKKAKERADVSKLNSKMERLNNANKA